MGLDTPFLSKNPLTNGKSASRQTQTLHTPQRTERPRGQGSRQRRSGRSVLSGRPPDKGGSGSYQTVATFPKAGGLRRCWSSHYQNTNRGRRGLKYTITLKNTRRESRVGSDGISQRVLRAGGDWSLGPWQSVNHFHITGARVCQLSLICRERPSLSFPVTTLPRE